MLITKLLQNRYFTVIELLIEPNVPLLLLTSPPAKRYTFPRVLSSILLMDNRRFLHRSLRVFSKCMYGGSMLSGWIDYCVLHRFFLVFFIQKKFYEYFTLLFTQSLQVWNQSNAATAQTILNQAARQSNLAHCFSRSNLGAQNINLESFLFVPCL